MPTEFKRRAITSIKSDIYSLGAIILELVAGSAKLGVNGRNLNLQEVIDHVRLKNLLPLKINGLNCFIKIIYIFV